MYLHTKKNWSVAFATNQIKYNNWQSDSLAVWQSLFAKCKQTIIEFTLGFH